MMITFLRLFHFTLMEFEIQTIYFQTTFYVLSPYQLGNSSKYILRLARVFFLSLFYLLPKLGTLSLENWTERFTVVCSGCHVADISKETPFFLFLSTLLRPQHYGVEVLRRLVWQVDKLLLVSSLFNNWKFTFGSILILWIFVFRVSVKTFHVKMVEHVARFMKTNHLSVTAWGSPMDPFARI